MKYAFDIAHCQVCLYVPEAEGSLPVIWLPCQKSQGENVFALLQQKCVLACVTGMNWNDDLSPWPAPRLFASSQDFGGKASAFLSLLSHHILPAMEAQLSFSVDARGIAGYSMAGLFALYSIYHTDLFSSVASVSGSLWFDGWVEYALSHSFSVSSPYLYLSLGQKEHRTRNARMARVKRCTQALADAWQTPLILHPGGHFQDPELRLAQGIDALTLYLSSQ